jgi:tetratricopeptide (TPR) repeat protein
MNRTAKTIINLLIISKLLHTRSQQANRLIDIADTAAAIHHHDLLTQASHALSTLGLDEAGAFYLALANHRAIAERGPELFRAKSLITLGTFEFRNGNYQQAESYYSEASRLSADYLTSLHVQEMRAQILSQDGNHKQALQYLVNAPGLPLSGPHRLNHLNSLAVVLNDLGRVSEARHVLQPCLSSPYLIYYPEWQETAIEMPSRSIVSIPAIPHNAARLSSRPLAMNLFRIKPKEKARTEFDDLADGRELILKARTAVFALEDMALEDKRVALEIIESLPALTPEQLKQLAGIVREMTENQRDESTNQ